MKILRKMPSWIISAIIAATLTSGVSYAYNAATVTGQVDIQEPITIVGGNSFSIDLYPGDIDNVDLQIKNSGTTAMTVTPVATITPNAGQEVNFELPQTLTLDAGQTIDVAAQAFATNSAPPGKYTVTITFQR